jgi:hypothetical protein
MRYVLRPPERLLAIERLMFTGLDDSEREKLSRSLCTLMQVLMLSWEWQG